MFKKIKNPHFSFQGILFVLLLLMSPEILLAYSFKAGNIYYKITSNSSTERTVSVTYQNYISDDDKPVSMPNGYIYDYVNDHTNDPENYYYCYAYSDYTNNIFIPNTVTYNGVSYTVTAIDAYAFMNCRDIQSITIPTSVTSIGRGAFMNCHCLNVLTIPNSITYLGQNLFVEFTGSLIINCSQLQYTHPYYYYSDDYPVDIYYNNHWPFENGGFYSINLGNNISYIQKNSFRNCPNLTTAQISNSVNRIGEFSFYNCSNLTAIDINNDNLTLIENSAFASCPNLKVVNICNFTNWLGCYFGNKYSSPFCNGADLYISNNKISNLSLPLTTVSIPAYSFYGCKSLTSVSVPVFVSSIGNEAFSDCTEITDIAWYAKNCTSTGDMYTYNIERVVIGDEVETIPPSFICGSKITELTISKSVTSIGRRAFSCNGLMNIFSQIEDPNNITLGEEIFKDVNKSSCILTVPANSILLYRNALQWKDFLNILPDITFGDVNGDGNVTVGDVTEIYNYLLNNDMTNYITCDVNGDGHITTADITMIYNYILGN